AGAAAGGPAGGRLGPVPVLPHLGDQGDAGAVGEVDVGGGVQHHQVGTGAGGEVADVVAAQGARAAEGGRPQGLVGGHPHLPYRDGDAERHRRGEAGAGVAVGGERDGGARVEQAARVRIGGAGGELRAGQQGGDGGAA